MFYLKHYIIFKILDIHALKIILKNLFSESQQKLISYILPMSACIVELSLKLSPQ